MPRRTVSAHLLRRLGHRNPDRHLFVSGARLAAQTPSHWNFTVTDKSISTQFAQVFRWELEHPAIAGNDTNGMIIVGLRMLMFDVSAAKFQRRVASWRQLAELLTAVIGGTVEGRRKQLRGLHRLGVVTLEGGRVRLFATPTSESESSEPLAAGHKDRQRVDMGGAAIPTHEGATGLGVPANGNPRPHLLGQPAHADIVESGSEQGLRAAPPARNSLWQRPIGKTPCQESADLR